MRLKGKIVKGVLKIFIFKRNRRDRKKYNNVFYDLLSSSRITLIIKYIANGFIK